MSAKNSNPTVFWSRVDKSEECWLWKHTSTSLRFNKRVMKIYRAAYQLTYGVIDDHIQVIQTCGNSMCVRPEHLEAQSIEVRFWSSIGERGEGCWNWIGSECSNGYGSLSITLNGKHTNVLAHRLSYQLTIGAIPDGLLVCHKCDNRKCVRPDHLFLGSHKDNTQDMMTKKRGKSPPGEERNISNLTPSSFIAH